MTTPIGPSGTNPYGIGGNADAGMGILSSLGINIQGGSIASSTGSSLGLGGQVYMGSKKKTSLIQDIGPDGKRITTPLAGTEDLYQDMNEVLGMPADWARDDPKKLKEFVNKGIIAKIPGFDVDMGIPEIMDAWKKMVEASVELTSNSKGKWTPWDIMDSYGDTKGKFGTERKGDWVYDVATGKPVKYVGATSKTKTSKNINLTSAEDVRALAMQALREALGRAPTTQEVAQFRTSINAMERAQPEVTTTTVQLKPNLETGEVEEVSQESTTSGGVSQAAMEGIISQSVEGSAEQAKYQSGTTYYNALLGMLGG